MNLLPYLGLLSLAVYYAWRYSKTSIDPDWSIFNLPAFTGAWYGRDFVDCKSPLIYFWYYGIAKIVGVNIKRIRFAHHILISIPGIIVGGWAGLAFIVLINSGWLFAFHGNVGQQPAGMLLLALSWHDPWLSTALVFLAIAFEPKLIVSLLIPILSGWWMPLIVGTAISLGIAGAIWKFYPTIWGWLVEANLVITKRMASLRWKAIKNNHEYSYAYMSGALYCLPWMILAIYTNPSWQYWLPAFAYLVLIVIGGVIYPNHLLILSPWIALALPWQGVAALLITDWTTSLAYTGNIWKKFYPSLESGNAEAQIVGEYLKGKKGTLWANTLHTGVLIHACKPPFGGIAEQIEIRENAPERRKLFKEAWNKKPPDWVTVGPGELFHFNSNGYYLYYETGKSKIYRRL